jgi:predicted RNase H-like HicB family nuclease
MAGTMPHAIFVETDLDGGVAAYAAELPGCATFAATDDEAVAEMPRRASRFTAWLREHGEAAPSFVGDNWYEVERAAATAERRAAFSLDELPPSEAEHAGWLRWLELAREELAEALDRAGHDAAAEALAEIARQDLGFVRELGSTEPNLPTDPVDRLYAARDALTDALEATGPMHEAVRRIFRLAIADDLRAAENLLAGGER